MKTKGSQGGVKVKTKVRAGYVDTMNHSGVKVKTKVRAGINGLTTING